MDLARNGLGRTPPGQAGETYDLVVLDVMLPDVDGWRIVRALRDAGKQVPVLFLTARGGVDDRVKDWNWERTTTPSSHSRSLSCWRGCGRCCDAEALRASLIASRLPIWYWTYAPAQRALANASISPARSSRCLSPGPSPGGGPSTFSDRVAGMGHEFRQRQQRHRCSHPPSTREDRRCVQSEAHPHPCVEWDTRSMRPMMPLRHKPRQSRPASLALRVTALVGIATTLVFLVFNWVILRSLEHHFAQQDAHELEAVTTALALALCASLCDIASDELKQHLANAVAGHHGMTYGVYDGSGTSIYATPGP